MYESRVHNHALSAAVGYAATNSWGRGRGAHDEEQATHTHRLDNPPVKLEITWAQSCFRIAVLDSSYALEFMFIVGLMSSTTMQRFQLRIG